MAAGDTSVTTTVTGEDDRLDDDGETVVVTASLAGDDVGSATVTIDDDDDAPGGIRLTANPASVIEGAGDTQVTVTATVTGDTRFAEARTVTVLVRDGTAASPADYEAVPNFDVTIAAGEASGTGTFTLTPMDDDLDELDETVSVNGDSSGVTVTGVVATIMDDDEPTWTVTAAPASIAEGGGESTVTVSTGGTVTFAADQTITLTLGGTATEDVDYTIASKSLTLTAGDTEVTTTVTGVNDTIAEAAETVIVTANHGGSAVGEPATITINDDDEPTWTVTAAPASIAEGGGENTVTVSTGGTVTFAADQTITLTLGGTATEDVDYTIASKSLTLTAGDTEVTTTVTGVSDMIAEAAETVIVTASHGGGTVGSPATITINDDDEPTWTVTAAPASIAEGGGESTVTVSTGGTVTFAADQTITLTLGGTATENADYTIVSKSLTLTAGDTEVTTTVTGVNDAVAEAAETVIVTASHGGNTVGSPATITIDDDDATPTVSLALGTSSIGEKDGSTTVTATLSGVSSEAVTLTVSAAPVLPAVADDFTFSDNRTLTIAAGETASTGTVTITAVDNDVDAPEKQVTVSATAAGGNGVANPTDETLTITDDDAAPGGITLTANPDSVSEGAGDTEVTVTATVGGTTRYADARTVTVSVADGTAAAPADYVAADDFDITIAAGAAEGTGSFTLTPVDDPLNETDETIAVSGASGTLSVTGDTIAITDDDEPTWTVTAGRDTVDEGASTSVTVSTGGVAFAEDRTITLTLAGTAAETVDYTIASKSLTLTEGDTSVTTSLSSVGDTVVEGAETVEVTASHGGNAVGSPATITITDLTSASWTASASASSIAENGGTSTVTLRTTGGVTFTEDQTITLTLSGTATETADYTINSKSLTLTAGDTEVTTTVTGVNDTVAEAAETVIVTASHGGNTVGSPATITIDDDDATPTVSLALTPPSVSE